MDVGCMAKQAVNGWFADLVTSAAKPICNLLSQTVLGTPPLDSPDMARAKDLWGVSQTIANTCYVLIITAGGVLLIAGHSLPGSELTPGQLVARLVGAFAASNLSLILIGYAITFANGLSGAFLSAGAEAVDPSQVAKAISAYLVASLVPNQPFTIFIGLGVVVLALCVAFIYIIRIALTMVLIAAAPVALMFHALPLTDGLARLWWRSISGVLAIGVCQALVLATAFRLLFSNVKHSGGDSDSHFPGIVSGTGIDLLLALCLLWIMVRVPSWVARTIWRAAQPSALTGMVKSLVLYRGLGALMRHRAPTRKVLAPSPSPSSASPPPPPPQVRRRPALLLPSRLALAPPNAPHTPPGLPGPADPPSALLAGAVPMPPGAIPMPPGQPPEPDRDKQEGRHPMQLALPIPAALGPAGKSPVRRPTQMALSIPVTRLPRPSSPDSPASPRPRVRSRQPMLPGMPMRPVPRRQLTLWIDPPKARRRR